MCDKKSYLPVGVASMHRILFYFFLVAPTLSFFSSAKVLYAQNTVDYSGYYTGTRLLIPFILELTQNGSSLEGTLAIDHNSLGTDPTPKLSIKCSINQGIASGTLTDPNTNTSSQIRFEPVNAQSLIMHETVQTLFKGTKEVRWQFSKSALLEKAQTSQNNSNSSSKNTGSTNTSSNRGNCPEVITSKRIQENLDAMTMSFIKKDLPRLQEYILETQSNISCLEESISTETTLQMHQLFGMYHWINKAKTDAQKSFSVAKSIDSSKGIDTYIYPKGHFIHTLYEQSSIPENQSVKLPRNKEVYYFDGRKTFYRPKGTPTIFQIEQNGKIVLSQYLFPEEELPTQEITSTTSQVSEHQNTSDPEVQKWINKLNDHKLTYMSSYYSSSYDGSYVGGSERVSYSLCAKGTFRYYGHSNVSVDVGSSGYGHNTQNDRGNWHVQRNNNNEIQLVLDYLDGSQSTFVLSMDDYKTYLDDSRYYKTDLHDDEGTYQSNCQ